MKRTINLLGQRFSSLVVVEYAGVNSSREATWRCVCDCSKERIVSGASLRKGVAKSCGCMNAPPTLSHRLSKTREYKTLMGMIARCYNPKNQRFAEYGARGIKVCARWLESPAAFVEDMGPRPSALHSIERDDNNGNYEPGNCRWATKTEQGRNRRSNVLHAAHGMSMTLPEWSEHLGVKLITLRKRIEAGFPPERVFSAENFRQGPRSQAPSQPA